MIITFNDGSVVSAGTATILGDSLAVIPLIGSPETFELECVKSITHDDVPYKDRPKGGKPTQLQEEFMKYLQGQDSYVWDKKRSMAAAAVILRRKFDGDFWLFGLSGEIMHNPEALLTIKL